MKPTFTFLQIISFIFLFGAIPIKSKATHIYGADLYYTHVSSNTYNVTLIIYGDCQGAAALLNALPTATPEIRVFNGSTLFKTFNLTPLSVSVGQGIEVTPVCTSQASQTACKTPAGPLAGVRKYTYTGIVDLGSTSANWIFNFDGTLNGPVATSAGRSGTITNVAVASTLTLNAALNNTISFNSSPVYTTIPTPFFCLNKLANYNPGAVDADGDSLTFALVDALNTDAMGNTSTVIYTAGYSGTSPLAASSVLLNSTTGQYSFIPFAIQRALVVYTVSEYRNGLLVGTSQREMTYIILNTCADEPPRDTGNHPSVAGVNLIDSTDFSACSATGAFTFQINPYSPSGNSITVSSAGLPSGATFNVTNNGSTAPHGVFSWNTLGVTPGKYFFFLTCQDDYCPISSKQTFTYSITILGAKTVDSIKLPLTSICGTGKEITLTDSTIGGKWKSDNPAVVRIDSLTGKLTTVSTGTTTLHYSVSNSCGTLDAIASFTVNSFPTVYKVTGNGMYCADSPGVVINLNSSDTGVNYFLFRGLNALDTLAGTGSPLNFGLQKEGVYYIFGTNINSLCVDSMNDSAIVKALPLVTPSVNTSVSPGDSVCTGIAVTFTATPSNGGTTPVYQWNVNGTIVGTDSTSYSYIPKNGDIVTVLLKSNADCIAPDTSGEAVIMTVDSMYMPSVSIIADPGSTITTGQSDTLTALVVGGGSSLIFQWFKNGIPAAGPSSNIYISGTLVNNDSVSCVVSSPGGCVQEASGGILIHVTTGVKNFAMSKDAITIFPNPTKDKINVSSTDEIGTVVISDIVGQVLFQAKYAAKEVNINTAWLPSGIYFLKVNGSEVRKFVKQ